ncbi:MAG: hypothetical protein V6S10_05885 [Candidatus Methanoglobus sp.]
MEPYFSDSLSILGLGLIALILLLVLFTLLIVIPGFLLWLSLRAIGKKRPLLKCGLANLIALICSAFITLILFFIPLIDLIAPLIFVVIYLWVFKEILDLGWSHAIFAVIISVACVMLLSMIFSMLFYAIFRPPWLLLQHFRF